MTTLLAFAVIAMLPGDKPLGKIGNNQFIAELRALDFRVFGKGENLFIGDTSTSAHLLISGGLDGPQGKPYVYEARGRLEFDLPHPLSKKALYSWTLAHGVPNQTLVASYLGGRVVIEARLATPETTHLLLARNIRVFLDDCIKLSKEISGRGGRPSPDVFQLGNCSFEPEFRLDRIDQEDMEFMIEKLCWRPMPIFGMFNSWAVGAKPLGIPILFTGSLSGGADIRVACSAAPDRKKVEKFVRNPKPLDWADRKTIGLERIYIEKHISFKSAPTAREVRDAILDFVEKVKRLDLSPVELDPLGHRRVPH
jgi:hypothetical protein